MSIANNALDYVNAALEEEKTIEYGDGELLLIVNEKIVIDDIYNAINTIVDNVVEREFEYELVDLLLPYFIIDLFTDIDAPMIEEDGEEFPDYTACYKIATMLNLEYELTQVSPLVAGYIYLMTQNIWRRLEYHKSYGSYMKQELLDALATFYQLMDDLDDMAEQQKDIDIDKFVSQINDISDAIQELNAQKPEPLTVLDGGKTSIDLVTPKSDQEE